MKKILLSMLAACFVLSGKADTLPTDTTIFVEGKRIEIKDSDDRMKIQVYREADDGEKVEDALVFEGHYEDGRSFERRKTTLNIDFKSPNRTWNRYFEPHWAGFSMGFANFSDSKLNVNDVDGVRLNSGKSFEISINALEKALPLGKRTAIVTGLGMRWNRYRLEGNEHFAEVNDITALHPAPEGITYKSSRLKITSLTVPLLLEIQDNKRWGNGFFLSGGVVGVLKTASSSRVKYRNANGNMVKDKIGSGLNLRIFTMDFILQAGYGDISIYARYSPFSQFTDGHGPDIHPVALGATWHF